jgi:hypothetical protein
MRLQRFDDLSGVTANSRYEPATLKTSSHLRGSTSIRQSRFKACSSAATIIETFMFFY